MANDGGVAPGHAQFRARAVYTKCSGPALSSKVGNDDNAVHGKLSEDHLSTRRHGSRLGQVSEDRISVILVLRSSTDLSI